jgi:ProP effector
MTISRDDIKRIHATIADLAGRWPKCFSVLETRRRPLKLGIHEDIAAAAPDLDPTDLSNALRYYVGNLFYLNACTIGAPRVDLNGDACGEVTAEQVASSALPI